MKEKMKFFIARPWCSQMIENTYHQQWRRNVRRALEYEMRPRGVVNALMTWSDTPQGDEYWRLLYGNDDTSHY